MGVAFDRTIDEQGGHTITLTGPQTPKAIDVDVPGDISSAHSSWSRGASWGSDLTLSTWA